MVTVLAVVLGLVLAATFVLTALRAESPLVDVRLLQRGTFAAATATAGLTGANMYGGLLLVPLYLQLAAGRGITETGLMLLVMGLGSAAALPVAGTLTDRFGAGAVTLVGAVLLVAATLPFVFPTVPPTTALALILAARGVGVAVAQMPAMAAAYASVTGEEMGDAATLINVVQRVGGALGAIAVIIILARTGGSTSSDAYRWAFASLAAISALTVVSATFLRKAQPRESAIRD